MRNPEATGKAFLSALAERDFQGVGDCIDAHVRFRALLPPGPFEWAGAGSVVEQLRSWFGTVKDFEMLEAGVDSVGGRLRISYRNRLRPHPFVPGSGWHVIEQQAFCDVADGRITSLDLLCSGYRPE